jgi:predicted AAA+ superfamily ATPase
MLSGELATLLSGRYVSFEILPFSYQEYLGIKELNANSGTYAQFMQSGGLPELFFLPNEESRRQYVSSVKDTVLLRDIIQKNTIRDPQLLEDVFIYLINNASNLLSINNITNYLKSNGRKTTYDTISSYIGYIQEAFLIHKAERYDIKGKEIISGNSKFYANDLSYKNYLYSGFGYGIGYQLENLIYLALRNANFDIYVGHLPKNEVDFIAKRHHQTLYVQCAYLLLDPATLNREYAALEAISDNYTKIIVSMDEVLLPSKNGILHLQAWNFETYLETIH